MIKDLLTDLLIQPGQIEAHGAALRRSILKLHGDLYLIPVGQIAQIQDLCYKPLMTLFFSVHGVAQLFRLVHLGVHHIGSILFHREAGCDGHIILTAVQMIEVDDCRAFLRNPGIAGRA